MPPAPGLQMGVGMILTAYDVLKSPREVRTQFLDWVRSEGLDPDVVYELEMVDGSLYEFTVKAFRPPLTLVRDAVTGEICGVEEDTFNWVTSTPVPTPMLWRFHPRPTPRRTVDHDYSRQIANVRTYFPPTEETRAHYEFLRARVADLMEQFTFHCPPSRELSLALTKLEEAQFFANAAIARHAGPPAQS